MNKIDVDTVYKNLLEIEGLILLIKERGDDAPDELLSHFKERMLTLCDLLRDDLAGKPACREKQEESCIEGTPIHEHNIYENESDTDESVETETVHSALDENVHVLKSDDYEQIASAAEFEEDEDADEIGQEIAEPPVDSDVIRVGNVLPHKAQHDLRRSFTLNDRFRFRRELFGNNDNEFTDALNLVSAMNSLSEAEEYFYEDLGWDASNEEVKEFISIISRHFNVKR